MKVTSKIVVLFVVFLLCVALVTAALFSLDFVVEDVNREPQGTGEPNKSDIEKDMNTVYIDGEEYYRKKNVVNYLMIGIDSFGETDDGGVAQADFIVVLSFDLSAKTYTLVRVNRDTMTDVDVYDIMDTYVCTRREQIALSHAYGTPFEMSNVKKCKNTEKSVSALLHGVKFKDYVSMTMSAVGEIVDMMGGVSVYMSEDWSEIDERMVQGATVKMDGDMALRFIRARGELTDSTNIARMRRQEAFLEAFTAQLGELDMKDDDMLAAYDKIAPYLVSASGADTLLEMADKVSAYKSLGAVDLPGEAVMGEKFMEFHADAKGLKDVVTKVFFDKSE